MITRRFVEATDQVFEYEPHRDVIDFVWVKVDLGELGDNLIKAVGLLELLDLGVELEALENLSDVPPKATDAVDYMVANTPPYGVSICTAFAFTAVASPRVVASRYCVARRQVRPEPTQGDLVATEWRARPLSKFIKRDSGPWLLVLGERQRDNASRSVSLVGAGAFATGIRRGKQPYPADGKG